MKKTIGFLVSIGAVAAIIWGCQCVPERDPEQDATEVLVAQPEQEAEEPAAEKVEPPPRPPLKQLHPAKSDGFIGRKLSDQIAKAHVSQMKFDDDVSRRAWTNLVTFYDFDHSVFLKSDLDRLAQRENNLDDEIKAGNVSFGFDIYNLYVERLRERVDFATNLAVSANFDFTSNETYRIRRKDAPWPESREAAEEHWRRRIKNEFLVAKVNHELDKSTNALEIVDNMVKRYKQYATVLMEPDEEAVLQHYLSAVTRAFDPHSDYMSPASKEDFDMEMNLTLCGVGAVLSMDDGALKIVEIMSGGPMDVDGRIHEGDKIVGVQQGDGEMEDIMWQPMKKSIKKIRGRKGTRVTLEIVPRSDPSGTSKKRIELVRDEIKLEDQAATGRVDTVTFNGATAKIGYVYLPGFYGTMDRKPSDPGFRSCTLDIAKYIAEFNAEDVKGLILDLRGNGGGSLREAVMLSALFVPGGTAFSPEPVVQIRDVRTIGTLPIPPGNPAAFKRPMIVLTDRASASASEIVAGFLQDTGRAVIVGDARTHGKGTVQSVMGLGPEQYGSCKITTARFYRIDGRSTQLEGVSADIHLPSLLDSLDIGEDKLTYALPFSRISPADYRLAWNMHAYVPALKSFSEKRLEGNARYLKHLENVKGMREIADRETVSLEYNARKAQMAADRTLRELDELDDENDEDSEKKKSKRRRRNEPKKDDVVLDESKLIMMDLLRLIGDDELPKPRGDWF